jgi:hypothetical protein
LTDHLPDNLNLNPGTDTNCYKDDVLPSKNFPEEKRWGYLGTDYFAEIAATAADVAMMGS